MSDVNQRLYEIQQRIEKVLEIEDIKVLKEVHNMIEWKRNVSPKVQSEINKLDDIFYFLNGVLFEKGIAKGWGGNLK